MEITRVIFRCFDDGEMIALFPDIKNGKYILSYIEMGQHGDADLNHTLSITNSVNDFDEYQDLYHELESIGYVLEVVKSD